MVTNPEQALTWGVIADRKAHQMANESIGVCHRQALWCSQHTDVWPHGQQGGCNTYLTCVQAGIALIASARG